MKNISDAVEIWHTEQDLWTMPLWEFLGMTHRDYQRWLEEKMTPEELAEFGFYE